MKWKKSVMVMVVLLMGVLVKVDYAFGESFSAEIPSGDVIEVLYEGNDQSNSNDFYRIIIKYPKASSPTREIPEKLVIYEKDLSNGTKKEVHRVDFGVDAGKPLSQATDQSFLDLYDSFYYRKFTVEKNKDATDYEYSCDITFKAKPELNRPAITKTSNNPITVSVKQPIQTEILKLGTYNMFGGTAAVKLAYNKQDKFLPKNYDKGTKDSWPMDESFPSGEITMNNASISTFVANASLETHVMYTGPQLATTKRVKFILRSDYTTTNSKNISFEREIPAISNRLTALAQKGEIQPNSYNKEHFEVFMGMGSGAGGSISGSDNVNDVSYLFATDMGKAHTKFVIKIEDEAGNHVPGFVFDYINVKYNPFILGAAEKGTGDAFVKPSGYMMLNDKFKVPGDTPKPEMTLNMDAVLKSGGELKNLIDFDETQIKLYIAKEGTDFTAADLCSFTWDTDPGVTERIMKIDIPAAHLITIPDPDDPLTDIIHLKDGQYKIKMHIPTKLGSGYNTIAYQGLVTANSVYPIQLKVIMDEPMFADRPDLQVRVDKKFEITPYKMPNIH